MQVNVIVYNALFSHKKLFPQCKKLFPRKQLFPVFSHTAVSA